MRAALDDGAILHHENLVGITDRGQAVRHDKRRPARLQPRQRGLDLLLGIGIKRRRGLVEKQDGRVLQHRAGNRDALALTTREAVAHGANPRVIAVIKRHDEFMRRRRAGRRLDIRARRLGAAKADIGGDRIIEQHGILTDQRQVAAQAGKRHLGYIGAVDRDRPGGSVEEAWQQIDHRTLAGTAWPDKRHDLARACCETHLAKRRRAILRGGVVGKADSIEPDIT